MQKRLIWLTMIVFVVGFGVANASHYRKDPPSECKTIDPGDFTYPPITILRPIQPDTTQTHPLAEVWVKCKLGPDGKAAETEVVWCNVKDTSFEVTALESVNATSFNSSWTGNHGKNGWFYHTVLFRRQLDQKSTKEESSPTEDEYVPVEIQPVMINQTQPVYPQYSKQKNSTGTVWVKVLVSRFGTVEEVRIGTSSGDTVLDNAAMLAAYRSKFKPAIQKERAVACWVTYRVDFKVTNR
jgi:TonB family protein